MKLTPVVAVPPGERGSENGVERHGRNDLELGAFDNAEGREPLCARPRPDLLTPGRGLSRNTARKPPIAPLERHGEAPQPGRPARRPPAAVAWPACGWH